MSINEVVKAIKRQPVMELKVIQYLMGLAQRGEDVMPNNDKAFEFAMRTLSEPQGDRSAAVRPSSLGKCPRAQVFGWMGLPGVVEARPYLQNIFADGHFRHLRWQIMLLNLELVDECEVPLWDEDLGMVGIADGINYEEGWLLELKGTSQYNMVERSGVLPQHKKQAIAYMIMSGMKMTRFIYECKSSQRFIEIPYEYDKEIAREVKTEAKSIARYGRSGTTLPPMLPECNERTGAYEQCSYREFCPKARGQQDARAKAHAAAASV